MCNRKSCHLLQTVRRPSPSLLFSLSHTWQAIGSVRQDGRHRHGTLVLRTCHRDFTGIIRQHTADVPLQKHNGSHGRIKKSSLRFLRTVLSTSIIPLAGYIPSSDCTEVGKLGTKAELGVSCLPTPDNDEWWCKAFGCKKYSCIPFQVVYGMECL